MNTTVETEMMLVWATALVIGGIFWTSVAMALVHYF
jgi:hypothetical protein